MDRSTEALECEGGNYVRVGVTLDVYQPLCRGRIIKVEGGEKVWVNFRYECLPNICYWCGCFDHSNKDCDIWIESKGTLQTTSRQFGSWLRANQTGPSKKNVVRVLGFYEDRAENISTWRRQERKQFPTQAKMSKTAKQPEKDSSDMEVDFADFPNTESCDVTSQHGKSNSSPLEHKNMREYFSQKIREVGEDLSIYDNSTNSAQAEKIISKKETSPLFDLEKLRNELEENQSLQQPHNSMRTPHESRGTPLQDISNTP